MRLSTKFSMYMKKSYISPVAKKCLMVFIGIVVIPLILFASHFRYGSISWQNTTGNTVVFKVSQAWRMSFFFFGTPAIGTTVTTGTLNFGDGNSQNVTLTVTSVNPSEDWFYGTATITHTYATSGDYTAYFDGCCRISTLQNNADGNYRVESEVNVGNGYSSPVSTILPIINVAANSLSANFNIPAADPDGVVLSYRLSSDVEASGLTGGFNQPSGLSINNSTGQMTFNTIGKLAGELYSTQVMIGDGDDEVALDFIIRIVNIVANNNPPVFDYLVTPTDGYIINAVAGNNTTFNVKALDNDAGNTLLLSVAGVPVGASFSPSLPLSTNPALTQFSWTPTTSDVGSHVLSFNAVDNHGASANTSITINVIAQSINTGALGQTLLCPGSTVSVPYTATGSYNSGNIFTAQLSDATGSFVTPTSIGSITSTSSGTINATVPSGTPVGTGYRIRVGSSDPAVVGSDNGNDLIVETAPVVSSITPSTYDPIQKGTSITVSVAYTGNNLSQAQLSWGDGNSEAIGNTSNVHTYTEAGVYTVTAALTDNCNRSSSQVYQYVVVFDPNAGFITGGGWITSPPGAYAADPSLADKANFGFVSKYQKGQTKPSGNTQFQFHAAGMDFKSTSYEWLVISGARGQFKGLGTINGAGDYGFLLSAIDGAVNGGDGVDKFRIKIWDRSLPSGSNIVYDNQMNAAEDAEPTTAIEGGSIVIHVPAKGKTTTTTESSVNQREDLINNSKLTVAALPNPSSGLFTLKAQGGSSESMRVRVLDVLGRVVETRSNISANSTLSFGSNYRPGVYYVEVIQGPEKRMLKLVKQ